MGDISRQILAGLDSDKGILEILAAAEGYPRSTTAKTVRDGNGSQHEQALLGQGQQPVLEVKQALDKLEQHMAADAHASRLSELRSKQRLIETLSQPRPPLGHIALSRPAPAAAEQSRTSPERVLRPIALNEILHGLQRSPSPNRATSSTLHSLSRPSLAWVASSPPHHAIHPRALNFMCAMSSPLPQPAPESPPSTGPYTSAVLRSTASPTVGATPVGDAGPTGGRARSPVPVPGCPPTSSASIDRIRTRQSNMSPPRQRPVPNSQRSDLPYREGPQRLHRQSFQGLAPVATPAASSKLLGAAVMVVAAGGNPLVPGGEMVPGRGSVRALPGGPPEPGSGRVLDGGLRPQGQQQQKRQQQGHHQTSVATLRVRQRSTERRRHPSPGSMRGGGHDTTGNATGGSYGAGGGSVCTSGGDPTSSSASSGANCWSGVMAGGGLGDASTMASWRSAQRGWSFIGSIDSILQGLANPTPHFLRSTHLAQLRPKAPLPSLPSASSGDGTGRGGGGSPGRYLPPTRGEQPRDWGPVRPLSVGSAYRHRRSSSRMAQAPTPALTSAAATASAAAASSSLSLPAAATAGPRASAASLRPRSAPRTVGGQSLSAVAYTASRKPTSGSFLMGPGSSSSASMSTSSLQRSGGQQFSFHQLPDTLLPLSLPLAVTSSQKTVQAGGRRSRSTAIAAAAREALAAARAAAAVQQQEHYQERTLNQSLQDHAAAAQRLQAQLLEDAIVGADARAADDDGNAGTAGLAVQDEAGKASWAADVDTGPGAPLGRLSGTGNGSLLSDETFGTAAPLGRPYGTESVVAVRHGSLSVHTLTSQERADADGLKALADNVVAQPSVQPTAAGAMVAVAGTMTAPTVAGPLRLARAAGYEDNGRTVSASEPSASLSRTTVAATEVAGVTGEGRRPPPSVLFSSHALGAAIEASIAPAMLLPSPFLLRPGMVSAAATEAVVDQWGPLGLQPAPSPASPAASTAASPPSSPPLRRPQSANLASTSYPDSTVASSSVASPRRRQQQEGVSALLTFLQQKFQLRRERRRAARALEGWRRAAVGNATSSGAGTGPDHLAAMVSSSLASASEGLAAMTSWGAETRLQAGPSAGAAAAVRGASPRWGRYDLSPSTRCDSPMEDTIPGGSSVSGGGSTHLDLQQQQQLLLFKPPISRSEAAARSASTLEMYSQGSMYGRSLGGCATRARGSVGGSPTGAMYASTVGGGGQYMQSIDSPPRSVAASGGLLSVAPGLQSAASIAAPALKDSQLQAPERTAEYGGTNRELQAQQKQESVQQLQQLQRQLAQLQEQLLIQQQQQEQLGQLQQQQQHPLLPLSPEAVLRNMNLNPGGCAAAGQGPLQTAPPGAHHVAANLHASGSGEVKSSGPGTTQLQHLRSHTTGGDIGAVEPVSPGLSLPVATSAAAAAPDAPALIQGITSPTTSNAAFRDLHQMVCEMERLLSTISDDSGGANGRIHFADVRASAPSSHVRRPLPQSPSTALRAYCPGTTSDTGAEGRSALRSVQSLPLPTATAAKSAGAVVASSEPGSRSPWKVGPAPTRSSSLSRGATSAGAGSGRRSLTGHVASAAVSGGSAVCIGASGGLAVGGGGQKAASERKSGAYVRRGSKPSIGTSGGCGGGAPVGGLILKQIVLQPTHPSALQREPEPGLLKPSHAQTTERKAAGPNGQGPTPNASLPAPVTSAHHASAAATAATEAVFEQLQDMRASIRRIEQQVFAPLSAHPGASATCFSVPPALWTSAPPPVVASLPMVAAEADAGTVVASGFQTMSSLASVESPAQWKRPVQHQPQVMTSRPSALGNGFTAVRRISSADGGATPNAGVVADGAAAADVGGRALGTPLHLAGADKDDTMLRGSFMDLLPWRAAMLSTAVTDSGGAVADMDSGSTATTTACDAVQSATQTNSSDVDSLVLVSGRADMSWGLAHGGVARGMPYMSTSAPRTESGGGDAVKRNVCFVGGSGGGANGRDGMSEVSEPARGTGGGCGGSGGVRRPGVTRHVDLLEAQLLEELGELEDALKRLKTTTGRAAGRPGSAVLAATRGGVIRS